MDPLTLFLVLLLLAALLYDGDDGGTPEAV